MTKGSIGLNAGAIWNLLSDGQHWSFEALRAKSALTDADLWSAIGWLARGKCNETSQKQIKS